MEQQGEEAPRGCEGASAAEGDSTGTARPAWRRRLRQRGPRLWAALAALILLLGEGGRGPKRLPEEAWTDRAVSGDDPEPAADSRAAEQDELPAGDVAEAAREFAHTYYFTPSEADYGAGEVSRLPVYDSACGVIARVPERFFAELRMQGSGRLADGRTVSFVSGGRDCDGEPSGTLAFESLSARRFPWGRTASGTAVRPLRSVAVDRSVIPLGTPLRIAEFVGLPLGRAGEGTHDGCFVAEDVGGGVRGRHIDVFAGTSRLARVWNQAVPTRSGVTVEVDAPECQYLAAGRAKEA